jgi:nucleoid-associated protein YgaU
MALITPIRRENFPLKLQIVPEKQGGTLQFDEGQAIEALFNPNQLSFNRSVGWQKQGAAQRDVPELQFTHAEPRTLTLDLFFDTYDTPGAEKKDVRKKYTDKVLHLTTVEQHGDKHRPPVCRLRWGSTGYFFQGVLEKLDQKFTMFMADGTPVRATLNCTFKEWRTNYEDLNRQNRGSADVAKMRMLRRGDTLSHVAAEEYLDPGLWRPIAVENNVDDPLEIKPGRVLLIPRLTGRGRVGR